MRPEAFIEKVSRPGGRFFQCKWNREGAWGRGPPACVCLRTVTTVYAFGVLGSPGLPWVLLGCTEGGPPDVSCSATRKRLDHLKPDEEYRSAVEKNTIRSNG